jgi:hypothetical protein
LNSPVRVLHLNAAKPGVVQSSREKEQGLTAENAKSTMKGKSMKHVKDIANDGAIFIINNDWMLFLRGYFIQVSIR